MHPYARELRLFISETFLFNEPGAAESLADEQSLIESGVIDSTGVLELVAFLEERYQIVVADDELVPDNFDSIARLSRFIGSKRQPDLHPAVQ
jgi:acyl carrier protein